MADLYALKKKQLLSLEGFAEKKADNLLEAVDASRSRSLAHLIVALGIHGVGEVAAEDLAKNFIDLEALSQATENELQNIEGFGPNTAAAIADWFARSANQKLLKKLRGAGVWPQGQVKSDESGEGYFPR